MKLTEAKVGRMGVGGKTHLLERPSGKKRKEKNISRKSEKEGIKRD